MVADFWRRRPKPFPVAIRGTEGGQVFMLRNLGVQLDSKPDWKTHMEALRTKGQRVVLSKKAEILQHLQASVVRRLPVCCCERTILLYGVLVCGEGGALTLLIETEETD